MKNLPTKLSVITFGVGLAATADATLIDRGNGVIYDSDQDITWLQDANYAKTTGYAADGRLTWDNAVAWADNLVYAGYNDWRLPTISDNGDDGCNYGNDGTDCGFNVNTAGSELAYMWYDILGNLAYVDTNGNSPQPGYGLTSTSADGIDFQNLESWNYWSGTEYAPDTDHAWFFSTGIGNQNHTTKANNAFFAWAVRDGDVAVASVPGRSASVPEPGTLMLLAAGLVGVAGFKRQRC